MPRCCEGQCLGQSRRWYPLGQWLSPHTPSTATTISLPPHQKATFFTPQSAPPQHRSSIGTHTSSNQANLPSPTSQFLAVCTTATNTFSSLLVEEGTSIPAFQTFFNYVLLNLIYTGYSIYRYGFKGYCRTVLWEHGWKYVILSFMDVEGNYFTVLAYRYVCILHSFTNASSKNLETSFSTVLTEKSNRQQSFPPN